MKLQQPREIIQQPAGAPLSNSGDDYSSVSLRAFQLMLAKILPEAFSSYDCWKFDDGLVIRGTLNPCEDFALKIERFEGTALIICLNSHPPDMRRVGFPLYASLYPNLGKIQASHHNGSLTIVIPERETKGYLDESSVPTAKNFDHYIPISESDFPTTKANAKDLLQLALAGSSISSHIRAPAQSSYGTEMLEDDRIIVKDGVRYFPLSLAAEVAQVPRTTLVDWINEKMKFQGRALDVYHSPTARKTFLDEESVHRVARRFINWPSKENAGRVVLGQTDDQTGYIGIAKAAKAIGIDHHTIWLWIKRHNSPTQAPLNIIRCSASEQYYIHEKDISEIKKHITGLKASRRRRLQRTPHP